MQQCCWACPPPTQWPPGWIYDIFLVKDSPPSPSLSTAGLLMILLYTYCCWYGDTHTPGAGCVIHQHSTHLSQKVKLFPACLIFVSSMPWNRSISWEKLLIQEASRIFNIPTCTPWKLNMEHTNHPWKERKMIWTKPLWLSSILTFHCTPNLPKTSWERPLGGGSGAQPFTRCLES